MNKKIIGILVAASVLMLAFAFSSPVYAGDPANTCTSVPTYGGSFYSCTVNLEFGWNLISSPVVPFSGPLGLTTYSNTVNGIFSTNLQYVTSVYTLNHGAITWNYCIVVPSPTKPITYSCVPYGGLTTIIGGNGYWVYSTSSFAITISGYVIPPAGSPPSYAVVKGWNLVGFEPISAMTTSTVLSEDYGTYFASISTTIVASYAYCNSAGMACTPTGTYLSAPSTLYVGQAVWVDLNAAGILSPG